MQRAETVTFGGSKLDRAAELRGFPDKIAQHTAQVILFWRGKVLVAGDGQDHVVRLPADHPVLADAAPDQILLGREGEGLVFAAELCDWAPDGVDERAFAAFLDPSLQQHPALSIGHVFAELRSIMATLDPRDAELAATGKAILGWHDSHRFCAKCGAPSQRVQTGWQRKCPACGASHFPRTDPVVIMLITHQNSVLIGRSPGWPEGMYSLLAGFVEPGEPLEAAVRREVFEETQVRVGQVRYLASQPWPFPASLMVGCAGEAQTTQITVDPIELEDALWVSREEILASFAGETTRIRPAREGSIAHFILRHWLEDRLD